MNVTCRFPNNAGYTGWRKGCRCDRCVADMRAAAKRSNDRRPRRDRSDVGVCPQCGGRKGPDRKAKVCRSCKDTEIAEREQQVLALRAAGLRNPQIAERLRTSTFAVAALVSRLRNQGVDVPAIPFGRPPKATA